MRAGELLEQLSRELDEANASSRDFEQRWGDERVHAFNIEEAYRAASEAVTELERKLASKEREATGAMAAARAEVDHRVEEVKILESMVEDWKAAAEWLSESRGSYVMNVLATRAVLENGRRPAKLRVEQALATMCVVGAGPGDAKVAAFMAREALL
jgi:hypothetical protein